MPHNLERFGLLPALEDLVKRVIEVTGLEINFSYNNSKEREKEVLQLICSQDTTAEIAKKLFNSNHTVEGHRKNLLEKTNVKNVAGLVIFAVQNKLVDISDGGTY